LALFAALVFSANGQDLPRIRDSESPDHKYDVRLLNTGGKLQFQIREQESGKVLGDVTSVYEALQKEMEYAPELARKARAYWSPDSHYVLIREPDNSSTKPALILLELKAGAVERVAVDLDKLKAISPTKQENWSFEFGDWIGNRAFVVKLYGMTFHNDRENEHVVIPIICRIRKGGEMTMLNADE
jgi:hypothetical protein